MVAAVRTDLISYDRSSGRYLFANGAAVPESSIRQLLEISQQGVNRRIERATEDYLAGRITLEEWQEIVAGELKQEMLVVAILAAGGLAVVTGAVWSGLLFTVVGVALRSELEGLRRYGERMRNGEVSPDQIREYGRRKARQARPTYERAKQLVREFAGFNEAIRLLDPSANHCPECPGYERTEWTPIEDVIPVGVACSCGGRCRCSVRYRFNPERAMQEIGGGSLIDRVRRSRENQEAAQEQMLRNWEQRRKRS